MRHLKLLGLALLASFALGAMAASEASATEPGVLFLGTETAPVTVSIANTVVTVSFTLLPSNVTVTCKELSGSGTIGAKPETHSTLGSLGLDIKGCETEGIKCASVNTKGEKDAAGTVLLVAEDTDLHLVALLKGTELVPGILVGLLELEGKLDLTISCGVVKIKKLGALFLEIKGKNLATEETNSIELLPTPLTCDSSDTLCKTELAAWGATVGGTLCPLAATVKEAKDEECIDLTFAKPVTATLSKKVLLDF